MNTTKPYPSSRSPRASAATHVLTSAPANDPTHRGAFTRVELLAVATALALLGTLALPTLGGARSAGDTQVCLGNLRQLARAWLMYAEDNAGELPGNLDGGDAQNWANANRTWAVGWLDPVAYRRDNTNTLILKNSQLGRYIDSVSIFRCPADSGLSRGRTGLPLVRSYSMNCYVGDEDGYTAGYRRFRTLPSIIAPSPANCLVFLDEREGSINDGWFGIDMDSFDPDRAFARTLIDYPAARHDGGADLAFADGHCETWRWADPRTRPAVSFGAPLAGGVPMPNNPDVFRLQSVASSRFSKEVP